MIEVRVRLEDDSESVHLCDVPFAEVETLIPTLQRWGGICPFEDRDLTGQFWLIPERDIYFEIIVGNSD